MEITQYRLRFRASFAMREQIVGSLKILTRDCMGFLLFTKLIASRFKAFCAKRTLNPQP